MLKHALAGAQAQGRLDRLPMVKLNFNLLGYVFQEGIETLRAVFETAEAALEAKVIEGQAAAEAYKRAVAADPAAWIGQREDGLVLWDHAEALEMAIELAQDAVQELRKGWVIALYHHWERFAQKWAAGAPRDHGELAVGTLAAGYPLDPRLEAVRHLANTLKHDSPSKGEKLLAAWPEVLPRGRPIAVEGRSDWYGAVRLSRPQVLEVCEIIAGSGATADLIPGD